MLSRICYVSFFCINIMCLLDVRNYLSALKSNNNKSFIVVAFNRYTYMYFDRRNRLMYVYTHIVHVPLQMHLHLLQAAQPEQHQLLGHTVQKVRLTVRHVRHLAGQHHAHPLPFAHHPQDLRHCAEQRLRLLRLGRSQQSTAVAEVY